MIRSQHHLLWVLLAIILVLGACGQSSDTAPSGATTSSETARLTVDVQPSLPDSTEPPLGDAARPEVLPHVDASPQRPATRPRSAALRVALISDLNGSYGSLAYGDPVRRAVTKIIDLQPDLVISTGDMVAGQQSGLDYGAMWRSFHETVTDRFAAARIPFAVTPGNHDGSGYPAYAIERSRFVAEWTGRRPDVTFLDDTHYPERYAFSLGPALFIAIDASTASVSPEQRRWLRQVLETHGQRDAVVLFGHLPVAHVAVGREEEFIRHPGLLHLLQRHHRGVLYASGHHHAFFPGQLGGVRLLSVGCLGGGPRPLMGTGEAAPRSFAWLEIGPRGALQVEAYAGPGFHDTIERALLPAAIGEGETAILRDDVRAAGGSRP